jgi:transcriptional regulator of acetoin/glycerol metabolism
VDPLLLDGLLRHRYTHHTRELSRLLRLSMTTSPPDYLAATPEVMRELRTTDGPAATASSPRPAEHTREEVQAVLRSADGNVTQAAERLGMSRHALHRLIRKFGLD